MTLFAYFYFLWAFLHGGEVAPQGRSVNPYYEAGGTKPQVMKVSEGQDMGCSTKLSARLGHPGMSWTHDTQPDLSQRLSTMSKHIVTRFCFSIDEKSLRAQN